MVKTTFERIAAHHKYKRAVKVTRADGSFLLTYGLVRRTAAGDDKTDGELILLSMPLAVRSADDNYKDWRVSIGGRNELGDDPDHYDIGRVLVFDSAGRIQANLRAIDK